MRKVQWIIYGFVTLLLGLFSVGCGFDIIRRIEAEESYTVNLIFHPISAILFLYLLLKILERSRKNPHPPEPCSHDYLLWRRKEKSLPFYISNEKKNRARVSKFLLYK